MPSRSGSRRSNQMCWCVRISTIPAAISARIPARMLASCSRRLAGGRRPNYRRFVDRLRQDQTVYEGETGFFFRHRRWSGAAAAVAPGLFDDLGLSKRDRFLASLRQAGILHIARSFPARVSSSCVVSRFRFSTLRAFRTRRHRRQLNPTNNPRSIPHTPGYRRMGETAAAEEPTAARVGEDARRPAAEDHREDARTRLFAARREPARAAAVGANSPRRGDHTRKQVWRSRRSGRLAASRADRPRDRGQSDVQAPSLRREDVRQRSPRNSPRKATRSRTRSSRNCSSTLAQRR